MSRKVIVAGFHRSGTSLTSQLLQRSGVFLGEQLLEANYSNVHGHFEDREIVRLHDRILADNGLTWQVDSMVLPEVQESHMQLMRKVMEKREAGHEIWGFKDPRVCLLLEAWKNLVPDVKVLVVYRSPIETTFSLHKRAAIGLLGEGGKQEFHRKFLEVRDLSLNMWLAYNKSLLDFVRAHREDVLVLSFDMLRRGFPLLDLLNRQWELGLEEVATSSLLDAKAITESSSRVPVADSEIVTEILDTWSTLEGLSNNTRELLGTKIEGVGPLTEEAFYSAGDMYDVLIEGEFQNFKVEFLWDRAQTLQSNLEEKQTELEQAQKHSISLQRREELERAEKDLKLIIGRMSRSNVASVFRLKEEFRTLERRYLK